MTEPWCWFLFLMMVAVEYWALADREAPCLEQALKQACSPLLAWGWVLPVNRNSDLPAGAEKDWEEATAF